MKTFREFLSESKPIDLNAFKRQKQETERKNISAEMSGTHTGGAQRVAVSDHHTMVVRPHEPEVGHILDNEGKHIATYKNGSLSFHKDKPEDKPDVFTQNTMLNTIKKHFGH